MPSHHDDPSSHIPCMCKSPNHHWPYYCWKCPQLDAAPTPTHNYKWHAGNVADAKNCINTAHVMPPAPKNPICNPNHPWSAKNEMNLTKRATLFEHPTPFLRAPQTTELPPQPKLHWPSQTEIGNQWHLMWLIACHSPTSNHPSKQLLKTKKNNNSMFKMTPCTMHPSRQYAQMHTPNNTNGWHNIQQPPIMHLIFWYYPNLVHIGMPLLTWWLHKLIGWKPRLTNIIIWCPKQILPPSQKYCFYRVFKKFLEYCYRTVVTGTKSTGDVQTCKKINHLDKYKSNLKIRCVIKVLSEIFSLPKIYVGLNSPLICGTCCSPNFPLDKFRGRPT